VLGRVAAVVPFVAVVVAAAGASGAEGPGRARGTGWSRLPDPPFVPRIPAASVWTGRELVVWGDASRSRSARDGAAYDPAANRWRRLPSAPLALNQATAVWVGGRMIVFGARLDGGNHSRTRWARGIAYVPAADRWRVVAPFPLSPQASSVAAVEGKAVVWDYLLDAGLYDPRTDRWTRLPKLPLKESECYPASTTIRTFVLGWYCGRGALLRQATRRWRRLQPPRLRVFGEAPVAAGSTALFLGDPGGTGKAELWAYTP
jgi:hypothetical protein